MHFFRCLLKQGSASFHCRASATTARMIEKNTEPARMAESLALLEPPTANTARHPGFSLPQSASALLHTSFLERSAAHGCQLPGPNTQARFSVPLSLDCHGSRGACSTSISGKSKGDSTSPLEPSRVQLSRISPTWSLLSQPQNLS